MIALDPESGRELWKFDPGLDRISLTSPGAVVGDVIVVGSSSADFIAPEMPHGVVRAFDVRSGQLRWSLRTIPAKGEPGFETWGGDTTHTGAANVWSTITADEQRGLVFLPVSSASPDHYGGTRPGINLYSDSVVALDVKTGQLKWSFQTVHHDLWDYDLAAPPILIDIRRDGREVPAVVVLTKTSLMFVLHRETGVPLFPVEERPVPASDVPGEQAWPTQPFPVRPPPLSSHRITAADLDGKNREACAAKLSTLRNEGIYTPPSLRGTLVHPATSGGANWSGAAFDPVRRLLFVPVNNVGIEVRLAPSGQDSGPQDDGNSSFGPPLATAGGLIFHGGTWYSVLRIHDAKSGAIIGKLDLPAGVHGEANHLQTAPPRASVCRGGGWRTRLNWFAQGRLHHCVDVYRFLLSHQRTRKLVELPEHHPCPCRKSGPAMLPPRDPYGRTNGPLSRRISSRPSR